MDLVIQNQEGVLLTLRKNELGKNTWHLPGGRVLFRETIEQAARWIAKLELGVNIKILKFLGFMELLHEKQKGQPRYSISLVFLVKPISQKFSGSW